MEMNPRQSIPDFHITIACTRDSSDSIFLSFLSFFPLLCARSASCNVSQTLPQVLDFLQSDLLVVHGSSQSLLIWSKLFEFRSE